jgi:cellulose biosynthesis protein BcsQ
MSSSAVAPASPAVAPAAPAVAQNAAEADDQRIRLEEQARAIEDRTPCWPYSTEADPFDIKRQRLKATINDVLLSAARLDIDDADKVSSIDSVFKAAVYVANPDTVKGVSVLPNSYLDTESHRTVCYALNEAIERPTNRQSLFHVSCVDKLFDYLRNLRSDQGGNHYDVIVVDTPASLDNYTTLFALNSDFIVYVGGSSDRALASTADFLKEGGAQDMSFRRVIGAISTMQKESSAAAGSASSASASASASSASASSASSAAGMFRHRVTKVLPLVMNNIDLVSRRSSGQVTTKLSKQATPTVMVGTRLMEEISTGGRKLFESDLFEVVFDPIVEQYPVIHGFPKNEYASTTELIGRTYPEIAKDFHTPYDEHGGIFADAAANSGIEPTESDRLKFYNTATVCSERIKGIAEMIAIGGFESSDPMVRKPIVVFVTSGKGGSGKTSVALNLAVAFSCLTPSPVSENSMWTVGDPVPNESTENAGALKVLIIDADLQGSVNACFGSFEIPEPNEVPAAAAKKAPTAPAKKATAAAAKKAPAAPAKKATTAPAKKAPTAAAKKATAAPAASAPAAAAVPANGEKTAECAPDEVVHPKRGPGRPPKSTPAATAPAATAPAATAPAATAPAATAPAATAPAAAGRKKKADSAPDDDAGHPKRGRGRPPKESK